MPKGDICGGERSVIFGETSSDAVVVNFRCWVLDMDGNDKKSNEREGFLCR